MTEQSPNPPRTFLASCLAEVETKAAMTAAKDAAIRRAEAAEARLAQLSAPAAHVAAKPAAVAVAAKTPPVVVAAKAPPVAKAPAGYPIALTSSVALPASVITRAAAISEIEDQIATAATPAERGRLERDRVAAQEEFEKFEYLTLDEARALLAVAKNNRDKFYLAARVTALS